jgi:UDP-N-acetylglucosamine 2-epimerase (non-hydrolysing)
MSKAIIGAVNKRSGRPRKKKLRVFFVFGTRPEAIKLAPVVLQMQARPKEFETVVCVTGQHREMLDQVLDVFALSPDHDLAVMRRNQSLAGVTALILKGMDHLIEQERPDVLIVQGDTTTALTGAMAAFYRKVPVAHIEAGLRTGDFEHPFPEEFNRVLIDRFARFCFAPTQLNKRTLLSEGVPTARIFVTGNTGIDALLMMRDRVRTADTAKWRSYWKGAAAAIDDKSKTLVLVTMHRRESFGPRMRALLTAVRNLAQRHRDWQFVYPVHLNPNVQEAVSRVLAGLANVHLIDVLPYEPFVFLMERAHVILTDSGGIQEEAPSLKKPVIVVREKTERQEAIEAGTVTLAGNTGYGLERTVERVLRIHSKKVRTLLKNPYGDGQATKRILRILQQHCA